MISFHSTFAYYYFYFYAAAVRGGRIVTPND